MPARKVQDERSAWTLNLEPGPDCSIGYSTNEALNWDGTASSGRQNEDRYYTCIYHNSIQLYIVLDGHDGTKAVTFAQGFIPHCLLRSELNGGDKQVMEALRSAIVKTEREFFIGIDPYITRKVTLQLEIEQKAPEADSNVALRLFPTQIAEIGRLDDLIKGGTTVVAALIYDNRLYVANVGDSRALLCSQSHDGSLVAVQQLSVDHNTSNEEELRRLEGCGLDPNALRRAKRLGMQQNTRSIGDYSIKGGYGSVDIISHATSEPGTAEPHLHPALDLTSVHGFLILMSDGLYEAYEAWTVRPERVNEDIAHLVAQELKTCSDLKLVSQNVVDKVKTLYRDTCKVNKRSGRLDDITLVVKVLGRLSQALSRSQSALSPRHQQQPHPQGYIPPTAPITNTRPFDFSDYPGQYQRPPPPHHAHPQQPQQQHPGQPDYFRQEAQYRPEGPQYRPEVSQYRPEVSQYRPEGPEYRSKDPPQYYQQPWQPGGWYPPMTREDYRGQYPPNQPHQHGPHHVQPFPHTQPPSYTHPHQSHTRQESDPTYPYDAGHSGTKAFTPLPTTTPPRHSNRGDSGVSGTREFHTGLSSDQPPPSTAAATPTATQQAEPPPPPIPPRQESMHTDEEMTMYGWTTNSGKSPSGTDAQIPQSRPHDPQRTPDHHVQEYQTLQEPETPVNQPPPPIITTSPSLQDSPSEAGAVGGEGQGEEHQTMDEPDEGGSGFVYYDEDEREEVISSPEEEDEEVSGEKGGTIKPYIRFNERFPADLSWDEIRVDPTSS